MATSKIKGLFHSLFHLGGLQQFQQEDSSQATSSDQSHDGSTSDVVKSKDTQNAILQKSRSTASTERPSKLKESRRSGSIPVVIHNASTKSLEEKSNTLKLSSAEHQNKKGVEKRIIGLRVTTFYLLWALLISIIALISSIVLLSKALHNARSRAPSSANLLLGSGTSYATNLTNTSPSSAITIITSCPTITNTTLNINLTSKLYSFSLHCNQDCGSNNIFALWSYSLKMCLEACVSLSSSVSSNSGLGTNVTCQGVNFRSDLGNVTDLGGNCFLKSKCSERSLVAQQTDIVAAFLVEG